MDQKKPLRISRRTAMKASAVSVAAAGLASSLGRASAQTPAASPASATAVVETKPVEYSGGEAKLTYGYWDQSQIDGINAQIEAFTAKFPDISIEAQQVPWADYWT